VTLLEAADLQRGDQTNVEKPVQKYFFYLISLGDKDDQTLCGCLCPA
jgi:hypothetical protein